MLLGAVLLGLIASPTTASALKFEPGPNSPLVAAPVSVDDQTVLPVSYVPYDIAAADFDGDGYDDLAISSDGHRNIYIYLGSSDGTLTPSASNPIGSNAPNVNSRFTIHAVDVDDDGDEDLIVGDSLTPTWIETYLNGRIDGATTNPHESFGTVPSSTLDLGGSNLAAYYLSSSFGDKDGDGSVDMVLGLYGNKYVYMQNDGSGTFSTPSGTVPVPAVGTAQDYDGIVSTAMGDFDGTTAGDADDLVMISDPQYDPESTSPDRLLYAKSSGASTYGSPVTLYQPPAGAYLYDVQQIDLNGDEYDDIVFKERNVEGEDVTRTALGGPGGPVIQSAERTSVAVYGASPVSIGDYDGDGNEDLALPQFGDAGFQVALGDGEGHIALDAAGPFSIPSIGSTQFYPQKSASLDANGDGRLDLAAASGNSGSSSQAPGVAIMLSKASSGIAIAPESIDFGEVPADAELIAPQQVTVRSTGDLPLNLTKLEIGGIDPEPFAVDRGDCPAGPLAVGASCNLEVTMRQNASRTGLFQATIEISSDASERPIEVPVFGTLLEAPDPPSNAKLTMKIKSAKKIKAGKKLLVVATVSNLGTDRAGAYVVKATAPRKLTGRITPKAFRSSSLIGKGRTVAKFRIPVKRNAKGRLQARVSLTFKGRTTSKRTGKVKILSKRRR